MTDTTETKEFEKLKEIVEEFTKGKTYNIQEIENGFVLDIPVVYESEEVETGEQETRQQFVYLTANRQTTESKPMFQVFTICGPEDERFYKSALLLNMNLPFGAIALAEVEGTQHFVIVDTYLAKDVSAEEIEKSVLALAYAGDRMEKILLGKDIS